MVGEWGLSPDELDFVDKLVGLNVIERVVEIVSDFANELGEPDVIVDKNRSVVGLVYQGGDLVLWKKLVKRVKRQLILEGHEHALNHLVIILLGGLGL